MNLDPPCSEAAKPHQKKDKLKIFTVDTQQLSGPLELLYYQNPAHGFEELIGRLTRSKHAPRFRYFFYKNDPVSGPPELSIIPYSQTTTIQVSEVSSQDELDDLANLLETAATLEG
jgi:hypothetical protein